MNAPGCRHPSRQGRHYRRSFGHSDRRPAGPRAADLMARNAIGALSVVDGGGMLLRIITETDLLKVLAAALRGTRRA